MKSTKRALWSARVALLSAGFMTFFFGFPGLAFAEQARISNTGPDSYNKIDFDYSAECDVENNNNVSVSNNVNQNAYSGDAMVGGVGWEQYNPTSWQAKGYSYDQWQAAFNAYLSANQGEWSSKWGSGGGGGNTNAGDATSGDASNVSNQRTNIGIDNRGACGVLIDQHGNPVHPNNPSSGGGHVLGNSSVNPATNGNGVLGAGSGGSGNGAYGSVGAWISGSGQGSTNSVNYPGTSGGVGGGGTGGSGGGGATAPSGSKFSIDTTGPDSYNKIYYSSNNSVDVENNNNVSVSNYVNQNSSSGDAAVTNNTTAGGATSGSSSNTQTSTTSVGVSN